MSGDERTREAQEAIDVLRRVHPSRESSGVPGPGRLTQERIARNNDTFRQANEQIREAAITHGVETVPFICECADERCTTVVRLSLARYAEIRASARQFFCIPDHLPAEEGGVCVAADYNAYLIVSKQGRAGEIAAELTTDKK